MMMAANLTENQLSHVYQKKNFASTVFHICYIYR